MFSRRGEPPPEDPSVAPVEELLDAVASRSASVEAGRDGRLRVTYAVWLCACETWDAAPIWLIYAAGENGIGWKRVPNPAQVSDIVEAEHLTGVHPMPDNVLAWLNGQLPRPWLGPADFPEDSYIWEELSRRLGLNPAPES